MLIKYVIPVHQVTASLFFIWLNNRTTLQGTRELWECVVIQADTQFAMFY